MQEEILKITRKELEEIENLANEAIRALYHKNGVGKVNREKLEQLGLDGEAINWGDLKCYDVEVAVNVYVDEASPEAIKLQEYIRKYIEERFHLSLPVEVITEW